MLLEVDGVSQRFGGVLANQDISLTIVAGEILGLIGPNGAGKTTLFNAIAGAIKPTTGRILFEGRDITSLGASGCADLGIARTFQVVRNFETMTVLENIMVGAFNRTGSTAEAKRKALEVLDFTGMSLRRDTPAADLTPPEKRRLEVARALATGPKLLLLDEVMTGLTPTEAQAGVQLVRDIRASGVTILMVEHVMEVLMPLVDRCVVLNLGKVLVEGKPADIVRHPDVVTAYLGERYRASA
ncbi:MAG TPA: ABC transporter ATP-binding protein [Stellaceae bacterium]|nr:ABC transporter ATP-binding protein [Stellaceae bacterium]